MAKSSSWQSPRLPFHPIPHTGTAPQSLGHPCFAEWLSLPLCHHFYEWFSAPQHSTHPHRHREWERERERMRYILKLIINAANHAVRNALMYNTYVDKSYSCTQQPSIGQPATSPTQASLYVSCYVKLGLVGQTKPSLVPNSTNTALKHCTVLLQCCHQLFFQREICNWPCDGWSGGFPAGSGMRKQWFPSTSYNTRHLYISSIPYSTWWMERIYIRKWQVLELTYFVL